MNTHRAEGPTPTVDVHAHILLPALQQLVAEADPEGFGAQQALEVRRNGPESMAAPCATVGGQLWAASPMITVRPRFQGPSTRWVVNHV